MNSDSSMRTPFRRIRLSRGNADLPASTASPHRGPSSLASIISRHVGDTSKLSAHVHPEAGFTLVELMIVLLILAILLAIAIPTFLGVSGGASDRAVQSNLNTALTNSRVFAESNAQSYSTISTTLMSAREPSITWTTGAVTSPGPISLYVDATASSDNGGGVIMASYSKNAGECWFVVDNLSFVTGSASNGAYSATTASPGSPGTATSAPTQAGIFYGKAPSGSCNPSVSTVGATWSRISFADLH